MPMAYQLPNQLKEHLYMAQHGQKLQNILSTLQLSLSPVYIPKHLQKNRAKLAIALKMLRRIVTFTTQCFPIFHMFGFESWKSQM